VLCCYTCVICVLFLFPSQDARIWSSGSAIGTVRIEPPRGFEAVAPRKSSTPLDGVPTWVIVPLAILTALFGLVLIAAAVMLCLRCRRVCKARREKALRDRSTSECESSEGAEDNADNVYGNEFVKQEIGGIHMPTAK
jgi:hypothetical protein